MLALSGSEQTIAGMRFQATINAVFMAAQMVILVAARSTWSGIPTGGFVFHAVIVFMTLRELKEELAWAAKYRNRAGDLWLEKVEGHFQRKTKPEQGPGRDSPSA
jgi:hypothetical protein